MGNIDEIQLRFVPGRGTTDVILDGRTVTEVDVDGTMFDVEATSC